MSRVKNTHSAVRVGLMKELISEISLYEMSRTTALELVMVGIRVSLFFLKLTMLTPGNIPKKSSDISLIPHSFNVLQGNNEYIKFWKGIYKVFCNNAIIWRHFYLST